MNPVVAFAAVVTAGVRRSELNSIEKIVNLCPEFDIEPFRDWRPLKQRDIVVGDAGPAKHRINAALVTERVRSRNREARGVELGIQSRLGGAALYRITAGTTFGRRPRLEATPRLGWR